MDARSESGADFFYMPLNAPAQNCVFLYNVILKNVVYLQNHISAALKPILINLVSD